MQLNSSYLMVKHWLALSSCAACLREIISEGLFRVFPIIFIEVIYEHHRLSGIYTAIYVGSIYLIRVFWGTAA